MRKLLPKVLLFSCWIFFLNFVLGSWLKNSWHKQLLDKGKYWPALRWQEFRQIQANSVDVLFVGSSHVYRGIKPSIVDDVLNVNSFNMGSSGQTPMTTFFLLKEILRTQRPKAIVLDIYFLDYTDADNLDNAELCYDFFNGWQERVNAYWNGLFANDYIDLLFPSVYNNKHLKYLLGWKVSDDYQKTSFYGSKGWVMNTSTTTLEELARSNRFNIEFEFEDILEVHIKRLEQIIHLCQEKEIELSLTSCLLPAETLQKIDNYDEISSYFRTLAAQMGISYQDFNQDHTLAANFFYDEDHLNVKGANAYSKILANYLRVKSLEQRLK